MNAEAAIKAAAKLKDPMHYFEILDVDLIAEEYKVHASCYKRFVKPTAVKRKATNIPSEGTDMSEDNASASYDTSNFEEVKEYVTEVILDDRRAVSMSCLHHIYGLVLGKNIMLLKNLSESLYITQEHLIFGSSNIATYH